MNKIHSSNDSTYDKLLIGAPENALNAIAASRMSTFQVFIRYVDHADPDESYHDWLRLEYPENKPNLEYSETPEVKIPQYTYPEEIYAMFDILPRVDGWVTDEYLYSLGLVAVNTEII